MIHRSKDLALKLHILKTLAPVKFDAGVIKKIILCFRRCSSILP